MSKGDYGEGDIFIGVSNPELRKIAKENLLTPLTEIQILLNSRIHEERLLALILMTEKFKKARSEEKESIFQAYIQQSHCVNNWDLVDISAPIILGTYSIQKNDFKVINKFIRSTFHWERRMAMVATLTFIRLNKFGPTLKFAQRVLTDEEDLMHKATGWMLREIGKRDQTQLLAFIARFGTRMPRTMLRYAIEKLSVQERNKILIETKKRPKG